MQIPEVDRFLMQMEVNGYSPNTIRAYRSDLSVLPPSLNLTDKTTVELCLSSVLRAGLQEGQAIRTHNRKLACYRVFGKHLGWPDFLAHYKRPTSPPGVAHPLPEGVDGVIRMIEVTHKTTHAAMVTLTGLCGLRISEALQVRPGDFSWGESRSLLTVVGKGQKTRMVPISPTVFQFLLPRLAECAAENIRLVPLSDRKARAAMTRIGQRALGRTNVASHDMRMTFGTAAYAKTKDIRAVQELLGHASSGTTEGYTFVQLDAMTEAADIC